MTLPASPDVLFASSPLMSKIGRASEVPVVPSAVLWHDSAKVASEQTRPAVLARVARGDLAAVQTCMNRYGNLVWSMARRFSRSREDAEDAVQEIFLDLWKSAGRFDPERASEEAFVAMIARRRLIDRLRAGKRQPIVESIGSDDFIQQDQYPDASGEAVLMERALQQLRPEQREVLLLSACQDLSHDQISARTGLALGTVKTHARRGLLKLRQLLFNDKEKPGLHGESSDVCHPTERRMK